MTGIEREVDALADLPRADLAKRWRGFYRAKPPKGISRRMMVRAIAYEMQAKRYGGLKPAVSRQLQRIATGLIAGDRVIIKRPAGSTCQKRPVRLSC